MKKLKLSELNLGNVEVLSREQLKRVLGGLETEGSGGDTWTCTCSDNSTDSCQVNNNGTYFVDCCGYTGKVNDPDAHSYVDNCS